MNLPNFRYKGKLYLIPTTLGISDPEKVLPQPVFKIVSELNNFIVENEKTARRALKAIFPEINQQNLNLHTLNKHTESTDIPGFLDAFKEGKSMGLLSEAGCPGIADPGAEIVRLAHQIGIQIVPLVGPSSILLALMASGMNGQSFCFHGYLPIDKKNRKNELKNLERTSADKQQAQLFIETPYRNEKLFKDIENTLHPGTRLCIACDITLDTEFILTQTIENWKKTKPDLNKRPCLFIIQKDF